MKKETKLFIAAMLNYLVWGSGYFFLKMRSAKVYVVFFSYVALWALSAYLIISMTPLLMPLIFWIAFWAMWCSIFLSYDVYRMQFKLKETKIRVKVKKSVFGSRVRTRKR
jgi:hypothetical protein